MFFYRFKAMRRDVSLTTARILSAVSLLSYPTGALTLTLSPDSAAASAVGYGLVLLSIASYALLIGSSVHRLVGEDVKVLDEAELRLRGRALSRAYATFTTITMISVLYAGLAIDLGGWVPRSFEEYNGIFFGLVLMAAVLPIALVSWILKTRPQRD
jgi:hypothetical protein